MTKKPRQIVAIGGGGFARDEENLALERYIVLQSGASEPRVGFVPTASAEPADYLESFYTSFSKLGCLPSHISFFNRTPDLRSYFLSQDVIYVGGGNTKSMLAVWRDWDVPAILREAWDAGIVLAGVSAGAICWFEQGVTDSWAEELRPIDTLGFLPGSCCPHYDGEVDRRPAYHRLLSQGSILPGVAIDDWTGVHFVDTEIHRVIATKPAAAYRLTINGGAVIETPLDVHRLKPS
jgi:peptidase E